MTIPIPGDAECFRLLAEKGTPPAVVDHCRAVTAKADDVAAALLAQGALVNPALIHAGALVHDIAKGAPGHAKVGASYLAEAGYPRVAQIVADHEWLPEPIRIDESAVVYFADKLIQGTTEVTLEERFAASLEKCRNDTARENHKKRSQQAFFLKGELTKLNIRF
jgi:hypothetical protein